VRSLAKENYRAVKTPPELHTRTLHKPSCKNITARRWDDCLKDGSTTLLSVPQSSQDTQIEDDRLMKRVCWLVVITEGNKKCSQQRKVLTTLHTTVETNQ